MLVASTSQLDAWEGGKGCVTAERASVPCIACDPPCALPSLLTPRVLIALCVCASAVSDSFEH